MFRRKCRRSSISADSYQAAVPDNSEIPQTNLEQRSCSTSRLQEENLVRTTDNRMFLTFCHLPSTFLEFQLFSLFFQSLISNNRLNPGLSLSHDSIFTPDRADSGLSSSDLGNSSLSITVLTPPSKVRVFYLGLNVAPVRAVCTCRTGFAFISSLRHPFISPRT